MEVSPVLRQLTCVLNGVYVYDAVISTRGSLLNEAADFARV
jgi:hypothetical protein